MADKQWLDARHDFSTHKMSKFASLDTKLGFRLYFVIYISVFLNEKRKVNQQKNQQTNREITSWGNQLTNLGSNKEHYYDSKASNEQVCLVKNHNTTF